MKQIMDKLKEKMKAQKRLLLFLGILSLIGLVFGSIFITIISKSDQALVKNYIENFITSIQQNKLQYLDAFKNTIVSNLSLVGIIWLLGISIIGLPIILFLYFTKSFMIGFSVAAFVLQYKMKGVLFAIFYIFPHHLINLLAFTLLLVYAIRFSLYLLDSILHRKTIQMKNIMNQYVGVLIIIIVMFLFTSLYETFVVPFLFQKIIPIL